MNKQDLISKIKQLDGISQDERAYLINLVNTKKKYGLVWEDKPEDVEEQLRDNLPVLKEVKDRAIINGEDNPNHILIEGDNLHALTALTFTHEGKIDVIYIDPPYNTGNKDFVYNDHFVDKEDSYRHSKWLSFLNKRLHIAKRLLSEKGVIFISIDDNEQAQLKMLCDQIFNENNFEANITYVKKTSGKSDSKNFINSTEYILVYSKSSLWNCKSLNAEEKVTKRYNKADNKGKLFREVDLRKTGSNDLRTDRMSMYYPFYYDTKNNLLIAERERRDLKEFEIEILPIKGDGVDGRWRWALETTTKNIDNLLAKPMEKYKSINKWTIYEKDYIDKNEEVRTVKEHTCWDRKEFNSDNATQAFKDIGFSNVDFAYPKAIDLLTHILNISSLNNSIIIDFFAGSGTTLHATMALNAEDNGNRQCILVTNNENNICEEVTYERNKRVIQGYTNAKGVVIDGLENNNLRYFKSEFVSRETSLKNKRELTYLATELLCIKEDCYIEKSIEIKDAKLFENNKVALLVVFDDNIIPDAIEFIKSYEGPKIKVYVFSIGSDPYTEDFTEVLNKIELCALPDAIYKAYQNVLPKRKKPAIIEMETENPIDENGEQLSIL
jgi:adenine-specific DNA-methyltransferase